MTCSPKEVRSPASRRLSTAAHYLAAKKRLLALMGGGALILFGGFIHYWFLRANDWLAGG